MKNRIKLLVIVLVISCLCGCSALFDGYEKLNNPAESDPHVEVISYSDIKEGYYLSDSGDGSYYLIKDRKLTLVGYDWEKYFRSREPIEGIIPEKGTTEYEEHISHSVEDAIKEHTNTPFTPVKYLNYPEGFPYTILLVTDPPPEKINLNGFGGGSGVGMKDENTIGTESPLYIYCGTSLPESE